MDACIEEEAACLLYGCLLFVLDKTTKRFVLAFWIRELCEIGYE